MTPASARPDSGGFGSSVADGDGSWGHRRGDLPRFGWLVGVLVATTVGLGVVGRYVASSSAMNGFDRHVTAIVVEHRSPQLDRAMQVVTWFGSWVVVAVAFVLVGLLVTARRLPRSSLVCLAVVVAGEEIAVQIAKQTVRRSRPPAEIALVSARGWSFPSGHTATAFAVYLTLATLVAWTTRRRRVTALAWVGAVLAATLVAFSRVELGVHWTTDVVVGALVSVVWLVAVYTVARPPRPSSASVALRSPVSGLRSRVR